MLSPGETRQLDRVAIATASSAAAANASGSRLSKARGFGLDFREFRRYEPGDDPRGIDWMIHARLRQLVVRVHRADAHLRIHLLLDSSASMSLGTPDKWTTARRIAALLAYVGVGRRDAVGLATIDHAVGHHIAPATGRAQLLRIFHALDATTPSGDTGLNQALARYGGAVRGPGLALVISDCYEAAGIREGLRYLMHRGLTPAVIQVVSPEELDPTIVDDVELIDVERPQAPGIVVNADMIASYRDRMAQLSAELGEFCTTHGLACARVESSFDFERTLRTLLDAGLLAGPG
jgi:uncharacterized protein (DUF58 family)